jgi:hypothetical protein
MKPLSPKLTAQIPLYSFSSFPWSIREIIRAVEDPFTLVDKYVFPKTLVDQ